MKKGGEDIIKNVTGFKNKRILFVRITLPLIFLIIFFIIFIGVFISLKNSSFRDIVYDFLDTVSLLTDSGKQILKAGLPLLNVSFVQDNSTVMTPLQIFKNIVLFVTEVDITNNKTFLDSTLGLLKLNDINGENYIGSGSPQLTQEEKNFFRQVEKEAPLISEVPLVLIYNTHNAETYIPTDKTAKIEGKNAGVAEVAKELALTLEKKYGIKTVRSTKIHDYPHWEMSYVNSAKTVKNILEKYPSIEIVIDIHRDAGLPEKLVTTFSDGQKGATIMLVVGTDKRLPHPNWRKNWEFAKKVGKKMDELYPGLLKEVRVQSGRYNQHLHKRSILAEIGSSKNSLEEAKRAAKAFAHVISEVLQEIREG